jgi:hypothetical protein
LDEPPVQDSAPRSGDERAAARAERRRALRRRRLTLLAVLPMDFHLKRGVKKVFWAGMPRMGIGWFNKRMDLMNAIFRAQAEKRSPRVEYIDACTAVDALKTTYQPALRQKDGVHLSVDGGLKVANAVLEAFARDRHLPAFAQ